MSKKSGLSAKQIRFANEYLVDLNATQAAIRAGYPAKAARFVGYENLTKPHIAALISQLQAERAARLQVTQDDVLRHVAAVAYSDISTVIKVDASGRVIVRNLEELPEHVRLCVESVKQVAVEISDGDGGTTERVQLSVKLHSKVKALELLMAHLGMNAPQKHEHKVASTWADLMLEAELAGATGREDKSE